MPKFRENSTPDDTTFISFTSSVLAGMARAFAAPQVDTRTAELSHAEWLGPLLDREITERRDRRLRARLRYARLRHQATIEDVDYRAARPRPRAVPEACRRRVERRTAEP